MALSVRFHSPYLSPYAQDPLPLILDTMSSAHKSLDLCLSHVMLAPLVERAAELRKKGVQIRWVVDLGMDGATTEKLLNDKGFRRGGDWRAFSGKTAKLAHSFMVVDGHRVLGSTASWTGEGLYLQDNVDFVLDATEVASGYVRAMNAYWNELESQRDPGGKGSVPEYVPPVEGVMVGPEQRISAYFGPYDGHIVQEKLFETISEAETSVHFAFPSLADPQLVDALEERAAAGLHVSGVLDAHRTRIEHFERAPKLRALVKAGKIRMMHSFALENKKLLDGMQAKIVSVDGQYTHLGCSQFDTNERVPYTGESSLSIDSGPVARQASAYVEALMDLSEQGGHTSDACKTLPLFGKLRGREPRFEQMPAPRRPKAAPTKPSRQPAPKVTASKKAAPVASKKPAAKVVAKKKPAAKAKPAPKKAAPKKKAAAPKAAAKKKPAPKKAASKKKAPAKKKKRAA